MSDSPSTTPTIEVDALTKRYGRIKAIDKVSFTVMPGQIVGFLGPNGAGKSTTMRILCGLMPATEGVARICGIPVASEPYLIKRHIGYMPEHNPLPEGMRVVEYLRYRAHLKGLPVRGLKAAVDEVMELCDLRRKAARRVIGQLSKGYRQRVGIADAVLGKPDVIIMDEPTIGLDPHQVLGIRKLIDQLRGQMTVMLSSHILPEIEMSCDKIIIINQGRIVANGDSRSLRAEFVPQITYRLNVQTRGNPAALEALLPQVHADLSVTERGHTDADGFQYLLLEAPSGVAVAEPLLALLAGAGIRLRELARMEPNLEDIFMAATKRSWEESIAPFAGRKLHLPHPNAPESAAGGANAAGSTGANSAASPATPSKPASATTAQRPAAPEYDPDE